MGRPKREMKRIHKRKVKNTKAHIKKAASNSEKERLSLLAKRLLRKGTKTQKSK